MKFAAVLASLAVLATAAPAPGGLETRGGDKGCVSREHVQYLVDQETIFLQHTDLAAARAAADAIFAADIEEYGDSINSLRQAPVSSPPSASSA